MKCQNLFSGTNKKHMIIVWSAELAQSVVKDKFNLDDGYLPITAWAQLFKASLP